MKTMLTKIHFLSLLCALPALGDDVGLHKVQPNLRGLAEVSPVSNAVQLAKADPVKLTPDLVRKVERKLREICNAAENPSFNTNPQRGIALGFAVPGRDVANALEKLRVAPPHKIAANQIRIIQASTHGKLSPLRMVDVDEGWPETMIYEYTPDKGFLGEDRAVFEVEVEGYKIRVGYVFKVSKMLNQDTECPETSNPRRLG